jgi:hypothetical protein
MVSLLTAAVIGRTTAPAPRGDDGDGRRGSPARVRYRKEIYELTAFVFP